MLRDLPQACSKLFLPEYLSGPRRLSVEQIIGGGVLMGGELGLRLGPFTRGLLTHRKAFFRILNGRLEKLFQAPFAMFLDNLGPAVQCSGNGHREHSRVGDLGYFSLPEIVERRGIRGPAAGVER